MHILTGLLYTIFGLTAIFIILIVLVQRGKGGGLAGALGGVGGSSAFGTKAGDLFMKITVVVSIFWMLTAMLLVKLSSSQDSIGLPPSAATKEGPATPGVNTPPAGTQQPTKSSGSPAGTAPTAPNPTQTGTPSAPGSTPK